MMQNKSNYYTTGEAATFLGFSTDHVRNLINKGKIKAEKMGRNWIINKKDIKNIRRQRFPRTPENGINQ